ncbi:conserved hypothetical protein [Verticillium alfalfae VaMs.102]|uniref:Uncharacterized protein n=1 Tax=Verticillium alfalfae (strain VaMs.102 / ATCC MYA-4576 / FGSC 10136) TaxID=526221 RepID=C9SEW7_VERA1|nr:conserved hypothetical protein [Verticillium alfalfae VaMs.102]EEY17753.1 conserved hypothetical protein [Verticillium alfalfae VaMs.102]
MSISSRPPPLRAGGRSQARSVKGIGHLVFFLPLCLCISSPTQPDSVSSPILIVPTNEPSSSPNQEIYPTHTEPDPLLYDLPVSGIANLTKWEGTKWAKERYEKEQGITIRDTAADEFSEWVEPEDRPLVSASRGRTADTEAASDDEDMEGEDTDEEMESVGTALNERLRERVARREAGEHATVLDEEWEQWLKNAIESGELPFVTPQTMQSTNSTNTPIMPTTLFPPRMLSAARAGQWSDIPDFLHDMIQRSISVETTDREEPLMPPLTRAPRRGPTDERRHPSAPWLRPYSGLRLPVGDGVTQSSPDLNAPVAADPPGA